MFHKKDIRLSTVFSLSLVLFFIIVSIVFISLFNVSLKKAAQQEARKQAEILLDKNMSVHHYFAEHIKPQLLEKFKNEIKRGYFDPGWMSSSHAIRMQNDYFSRINKNDYYYKDAAINARSEVNEADPEEAKFIRELNSNPDLQIREGVGTWHGRVMFYYIKKGETMDSQCLICHSDPIYAPQGLLKIYGSEKSFNRKKGEIISAVSIKIPVDQAYQLADRSTLIIGGVFIILFGLFVVFFYVYSRSLLFKPLRLVGVKASAIASDASQLDQKIGRPWGKEIAFLVDSFNLMSKSLAENMQNLEDRVNLRTSELRQKEMRMEELLDEKSSLLEEKEMLLKEVNHRVKNNLNSIISILDLQKLEQSGNEEVARVLDQTMWRIHAISSFHELMHNIRDMSSIPADGLVRLIVEYIQNSTATKGMAFNVDIDADICFNMQLAQNIGLFVNEVLTNAVKYAFSGVEKGIITVSLKRVNGECVLTVADNGIGIPESFSNEKKGSLGMLLVNSITRAIGGTLAIENRGGSVITLRFYCDLIKQ